LIVLVVDDDQAVLKMAERRLKREFNGREFVFFFVDSAQSALKLVEGLRDKQSELPGIAILDGNLTGRTGDCQERIDLCRDLKDLAPNLKVISHTATGARFGDVSIQKDNKSWGDVMQAIRRLMDKKAAAGA